MKSYRRNGIKVDSDPKNDYQDGYNAGRRHERRMHVFWAIWWLAVGMAVEVGLRGWCK